MSRSKANQGCFVPGCPGDHYCHGYCMNHYIKNRRTGSPYGVRGQEEFAYEARALLSSLQYDDSLTPHTITMIKAILATWKQKREQDGIS